VFRSAPVTLAVGALCMLAAIAGEPLAFSLAWERGAILHGELWRLWSGHLVHYSLSQGAADALAFCAMGMLSEPLLGSRRFFCVLLGGAAAISLGLLAFAPSLDAYRGASGLAMLAAALAGVLMWRRQPAARWLIGTGGLALAAKLLGDAGGHALTLASLPAGVAVSWQAHLIGTLIGGLMGVLTGVPIGDQLSPGRAGERAGGVPRLSRDRA
jgi:rhomboid family GlyGly-CTERM serine protease